MAFGPLWTKKAGKPRCSLDGCSASLPHCVTVSRAIGWISKHCWWQMDGVRCQWIFYNIKQQYVGERVCVDLVRSQTNQCLKRSLILEKRFHFDFLNGFSLIFSVAMIHPWVDFYCEGGEVLGTGHPGRLWIPQPWQCSKLD